MNQTWLCIIVKEAVPNRSNGLSSPPPTQSPISCSNFTPKSLSTTRNVSDAIPLGWERMGDEMSHYGGGLEFEIGKLNLVVREHTTHIAAGINQCTYKATTSRRRSSQHSMCSLLLYNILSFSMICTISTSKHLACTDIHPRPLPPL
jgi:hypothetical protein